MNLYLLWAMLIFGRFNLSSGPIGEASESTSTGLGECLQTDAKISRRCLWHWGIRLRAIRQFLGSWLTEPRFKSKILPSRDSEENPEI